MNLSGIALALLAWQLLCGSDNAKQNDGLPFAQLLSEDSRNLLADIGKLSDKTTTAEQKTSAVLDLVGNPAVMSLASKLLGNANIDQADKPLVNDEGYNLGTPNRECREFFRPVENVADAEVKGKLYKWYDWYIK